MSRRIYRNVISILCFIAGFGAGFGIGTITAMNIVTARITEILGNPKFHEYVLRVLSGG